MKNLFEDNGAEFSANRKFRYALWRIWDDRLPKIMFIGLNPSTADENDDDPTIRRVKSFAFDWGYGGVYMLNLFTFITSDPRELKKCMLPHFLADDYLKIFAAKAEKIIFAWGNFAIARGRDAQVVEMFPKGEALIINKNGSPRHPLYVKGDVIPVNYQN
jgi:hypothetical protein